MKQISNDIRDALVLKLIEILKIQKFENIRADLPIFNKPKKISLANMNNEIRPDVEAMKDKMKYIFKVETGDTILNKKNGSHWQLLSKYADEHKTEFCLAVQKGTESSLREKLVELQLSSRIFPIP